MKQLALLAMFLSLVAFGIAEVIELRSWREGLGNLRTLVPVTLGIAAFGLLFVPGGFIDITPAASVTISRLMAMLSAVVACSGFSFLIRGARAPFGWLAVACS